MKTKLISTLKKDLLIIELPEQWAFNIYKDQMGFCNEINKPIEQIKGSYTLLGKADEIKEEDARKLVDKTIPNGFTGSPTPYKWYRDYTEPINSDLDYPFLNATESLLSALASEIYWENPEPKLSDFEYFLPSINEGVKLQKKFDEAQEKTFDKKRTLIFVKN